MNYESATRTGQGERSMATAARILPFSRQLNITLPENMADELQSIAERNSWTMPELIQNALGLLKIASDAAANKRKLVVADDSGKPLREIVLRFR